MSQTFHTITLNMLVLTVDGIYSAHSQHTPLPQNAMLDIISQAQHSGPEQHQEKNKLISTLHVGGRGMSVGSGHLSKPIANIKHLSLGGVSVSFPTSNVIVREVEYSNDCSLDSKT